MKCQFTIRAWLDVIENTAPNLEQPHKWVCEVFNGKEYKLEVLSSEEITARKGCLKLSLKEIVEISKNIFFQMQREHLDFVQFFTLKRCALQREKSHKVLICSIPKLRLLGGC